jgi:hypothetical protein
MLLRPCSRFEREIALEQAQTIKTKRPWIPRRCFLTNKWLWGHEAVVAQRTIYNGTNKLYPTNNFWVDPREYTLFLLGVREK